MNVESACGTTGQPVVPQASDGLTEAVDGKRAIDEIEDEPASAAVVFGPRLELARRYLQALAGDGVVRGLIGPREGARLWSRHVLNSGVAGELLMPGQRVVDIGSGAGLPGIPLAIGRPDCEFVLVEPLERRITFLREVVSALELSNCRVVRGRADEVIADCGNADIVTSRAVAPLERLARWSVPLLRLGGELLALKGSRASDEIARDAAALEAIGLVDLSVVSAGRGLIDPETIVIRGRRIAVTGRISKKKPSRNRRD